MSETNMGKDIVLKPHFVILDSEKADPYDNELFVQVHFILIFLPYDF